MNQENRSQTEWLWQELQNLSEKAEQRHIHPLLTVWAYLRYSLWLNFDQAPSVATGSTVAMQVLADATDAAQRDTNDQARPISRYGFDPMSQTQVTLQ
jgi:hypothetical protein